MNAILWNSPKLVVMPLKSIHHLLHRVAHFHTFSCFLLQQNRVVISTTAKGIGITNNKKFPVRLELTSPFDHG